MISIIIPVYNEEDCIETTIRWLKEKGNSWLITEIIVVDGGSTDQTVLKAATAQARVVVSPKKGRAAQMNYGASLATGSVLYFLHADTIPPQNFTEDIKKAVENNFQAGCYRLAFDHQHWFLKFNSWFTRFNVNALRFGDQSLFVRRDIFMKAGGFCEKHIVLEDQEIIGRLKKYCRFVIFRKAVLTSARKYLVNGIYKTQSLFFLIYFMYQLGFSQQKLVITYRKMLHQDKI